MTTNTIKQAAQAPEAWITHRTRDGKQTLTLGCVTSNPEYVRVYKEWDWKPLYTAPSATPEHDAQVRNAALEEAAQECSRMRAVSAVSYEIGAACAKAVLALKTTGADHA